MADGTPRAPRKKKLAAAIEGAKGGSSPRKPVEAPDSLNSVAHAHILDLVGEGEQAGWLSDNPLKDLFLDETPVMNEDGTLNFTDVYMDWRNGTQDQPYMKGFPSVSNEVGVGVELKQSIPYTRTINNIQLSGVRIRLSVAALSKTNSENGDINGHSVAYAIDLKTDSGAFIEVLVNAFTGKTNTKYERSHRIDLPAAASNWTIRVRRLTGDTEAANIQDTTAVESITEIIDVKMRYPNSAYVGIKIDAAQFRSIPSRAFRRLGRLMRIPSNYNPVTKEYTGIWNGTFQINWTNNPAWIFYDLCTNTRFGLGQWVDESQIDKWSLYNIAQYCDELVPDGKGGMEPRFTSTIFLQRQDEAYKVLQDIASVFRGISYWGSGAIIPVGDMPRDPVYTYTNANVKDGKFSYQGSARRARHTVALVSWSDYEDFNRQKVEYVEDEEGIERYGIQTVQVTAVGCTSQGQAQRVGRWILLTEKMETNTVSFVVGLDGVALALPGQVIRIADRKRAGRRTGGRVSSATANVVTVDAIPVVAIADDLICILPNGVAQKRPISSIVGNAITVSPAFDSAPVAESVWAVESPTLKNQLYSVISIGEGEGLTAVITALQHEPGKYDAVDLGTHIEPLPTTAMISPVQRPPTNVNVSATPRAGEVIANTVVTARWTAAVGAVGYDVQWRRENGEWTSPQRVLGVEAELFNAFPGEYMCKVSARNALGITSIPAISDRYVVDDQTLTPGFVDTLNASISAALETAENAQATADGAIESWWQPTAPVIGASDGQAKVGDLWFDTDDGNKVWRVVGVAWVLAADDDMAQAIGAATTAQATADGKVKTWFLPDDTPPTASAVGDMWFKTTTKKLVRWNGSSWADEVGDITKSYDSGTILNHQFEAGFAEWNSEGQWAHQTSGGIAGSGRALIAGPVSGAPRLYNTRRVSVNPGETIEVAAHVNRNGVAADGTLYIGILCYNNSNALISEPTYGITSVDVPSAAVFYLVKRKLVVPANTTYILFEMVASPTTTTGGAWGVDNVSMKRLNPLDDVPDGTDYGKVRRNQIQDGVLPAYSFGDELIGNGSFETCSHPAPAIGQQVEGKSLCDGWELRLNLNTPVHAGREASGLTGQSGAYRMFIGNMGTEVVPAGNSIFTIVKQKNSFNVTEGEKFVLECRTQEDYANAIPAGITRRFVVSMVWCDSLGAPYAENGFQWDDTGARTIPAIMNLTFNRHRKVVQVPGGTSTCFVQIYLQFINSTGANITLPYAVSHCRADDISVKRIASVKGQAGNNMLVNADFLKGIIAPWQTSFPARLTTDPTGFWAESGAIGAGASRVLYQDVAIQPLGVYSASVICAAGNMASDSAGYIYIQWLNGAYGFISSSIMPELDKYKLLNTPTNQHKRISLDGVVAPAAAVYARVVFEVYSSGNWYFSKPKFERGLVSTDYVGDQLAVHGSETTVRGSRRLLGGPRNIPINQVMGYSSLRNTAALTANIAGQVTVNAHSVDTNGEVISYSAVTNAVTGLAQSTVYVIYTLDPYGDGGVRTYYATTSRLTAQGAGEGVVIVGEVLIPTSGSQSGGGGAGNPGTECVAADMLLPDGTRAGDVKKYDLIPCWDENSEDPRIIHQTVNSNEIAPCRPATRILTTSGAEVIASDCTPMPIRGNMDILMPITEMLGREVLVRNDFGELAWETVVECESVGLRDVCFIRVNQQCYFAGTDARATIATHNPIHKP